MRLKMGWQEEAVLVGVKLVGGRACLDWPACVLFGVIRLLLKYDFPTSQKQHCPGRHSHFYKFQGSSGEQVGRPVWPKMFGTGLQ